MKASDPGFATDLPSFCKATGLEFLGMTRKSGVLEGRLRKPIKEQVPQEEGLKQSNNDASLIMFSDDMDKVLAGLVIANGAVAFGGKVNLFFTFWGLNFLK